MDTDCAFPLDKYILIGQVAKPHATSGELKIFLFAGDFAGLKVYKHIYLYSANKNISERLRITKCRQQGKFIIISLESVNDRNTAESLCGFKILLARKDIKSSNRRNFQNLLFMGYKVLTKTGENLGKVINIFNNGAHDSLVVKEKDNEYIIPIVDNIVIENTDKQLIIDPPPGLLEMNLS